MRFNRRDRRVELDQEAEQNVILIDQAEHFLEPMDVAEARRRGANSSVFRAVDPEGQRTYVVKFCRFPLDTKRPRERQRIRRFSREVDALRLARDSEFSDCVVRIVDDGALRMPALLPFRGGRKETDTLRYYVMDEADSDLTDFLMDNELTFPQQVFLCNELIRILRGLHAIGIYHRDVKADNILMDGDRPLFGDLGLVNFRQEDQGIDQPNELIGPVGLLSPEATNKFLGLRDKASFTFDCVIDEKSDIFQLGQVFWLVLQSEVPTGHLTQVDVKFPRAGVLDTVIHPMLQYGKERRASLEEVKQALEPVLREAAIA